MPDGKDDDPSEIPQVTSRDVSCDGGEGVWGHPKVYLRIVHDRVGCPYCSRQFVLRSGSGGDGVH